MPNGQADILWPSGQPAYMSAYLPPDKKKSGTSSSSEFEAQADQAWHTSATFVLPNPRRAATNDTATSSSALTTCTSLVWYSGTQKTESLTSAGVSLGPAPIGTPFPPVVDAALNHALANAVAQHDSGSASNSSTSPINSDLNKHADLVSSPVLGDCPSQRRKDDDGKSSTITGKSNSLCKRISTSAESTVPPKDSNDATTTTIKTLDESRGVIRATASSWLPSCRDIASGKGTVPLRGKLTKHSVHVANPRVDAINSSAIKCGPAPATPPPSSQRRLPPAHSVSQSPK